MPDLIRVTRNLVSHSEAGHAYAYSGGGCVLVLLAILLVLVIR